MDKAVKFAFETGATWATGLDINERHLPTLQPDDPALIPAWQHIQQMHGGEFDFVSRIVHKAAGEANGQFGPATAAMLDAFAEPELPQFSRCPLPDVAPPANASFSYADPLLQQAVERMQYAAANAVGSGSWPAGCWEAWMHIVVIAVDGRNMPAHWAEHWDWIKREHKRMCAEVGLIVRYVGRGERADIRLSWRVLAGSTIGLAEFPNGRCDDEVFHYLDPTYRDSPHKLLILHGHEAGHNWGLLHSRAGIMKPTIWQAPATWKNDAGHAETMAKFFGGEPVTDTTPPVEPEPEPERVRVASWQDGQTRFEVFKTTAGENPELPPVVF